MLSSEEVVFRAFRCEWSFVHLSKLFYAFGIHVAFTSLIEDVRYYVSTFIDYTFRTFAVVFIVWPSLYVWPLRRMMYDVLFLPVMTSCLMRRLFFFNYS